MTTTSAPSPTPTHTVTVRLECPPGTDVLPLANRAVADAGGVVTAIDVVDVLPRSTTVDLTLLARDPDHVHDVEAALAARGLAVRHTSDRVFLQHLGGKIDVVPRTPLRTRDDLSIAYTPGVARVSMAIAADPSAAWNLTGKGNAVAILTNGTAVLGLGDLGPLGALPVMEGKAVLFRHFAGVNAYPLVVDTHDADDLVRVGTLVAPGFGGINLEDVASPTCFEVERRLQADLDVPVFHDDQHGTAIVVLAALLNACATTGRALADARVVVVGIGAAGTAICEELLDAGVGDVVAVDRHGVLGAGDALPHHVELAARTNPRGVTTLGAALVGADVLIGVAGRGAVDPELVVTMAPEPIVLALSNPDPEVLPHEAPPGAVLATGRSDLPNQVNNALVFPGVFRGALDARAARITPAMRQAAATALAASVTPAQRSVGIIVPSIFSADAHQAVAAAVQAAAGGRAAAA